MDEWAAQLDTVRRRGLYARCNHPSLLPLPTRPLIDNYIYRTTYSSSWDVDHVREDWPWSELYQIHSGSVAELDQRLSIPCTRLRRFVAAPLMIHQPASLPFHLHTHTQTHTHVHVHVHLYICGGQATRCSYTHTHTLIALHCTRMASLGIMKLLSWYNQRSCAET